ncbi:hypothetical protein FBU59_006108 [Linderina macrospora]|uniref:Uncharacterized protein n=1 Tax=Linderina macrospora TaxID=4868 RepID=A0ACC1J0Q0_9FUNG|nr:hypothetical protein FBU59_006108 [Linderina macrospora]
MLYSTFRAGLCHEVEKLVGVRAAVRMEVDEPRELTAKALEDEVGLKTDSGASTPRPPPAQTKFKRPAPPGRRPRTTKP